MKEYKLINFCEFDSYATKSYCVIHDVDESLNLGDITQVDVSKLPQCDFISHGSPCQSFSVIGTKEGGDEGSGTKSSLMWNSVKIIEHCKPKFVIWENVKAVLGEKGSFNMPYGDRYYNGSLKEKLKVFVDKLKVMDIEFNLGDFKNFDFTRLANNDYVYCDPPYFNSLATYNENGGWTEEDESYLLNLLDVLNNNGIRFGLSNNLKYENPLLNKWKDKYNVHYMNIDYSSCNYHKKDKSQDIEVLITNY